MSDLPEIEVPELSYHELCDMAEAWVADRETGRAAPHEHIGAVVALARLLRLPDSERHKIAEDLTSWVSRTAEEHGYCKACLTPLERREWVEPRPAPFGFGTVGERMSETYCPNCEPEKARG